MKTLRTLASLLAAGSLALTLSAQTLDFDALPGDLDLVPNGYGDLQWDNVYFANPLNLGLVPSGYVAGTISGTNIATNGDAAPASFSASGFEFNLDYLYLTAAWREGLQVELRGYSHGALLYTQLYTLSSTTPTFVEPGFLRVDRVSINSYGGEPNYDYFDATENVAIDNVHITPVPEPTTYGLIGAAGLAGLGFYRRRTRRA